MKSYGHGFLSLNAVSRYEDKAFCRWRRDKCQTKVIPSSEFGEILVFTHMQINRDSAAFNEKSDHTETISGWNNKNTIEVFSFYCSSGQM